MVRLAKGDDLMADLGKSPELYTKFNTLSPQIESSGTAFNAGNDDYWRGSADQRAAVLRPEPNSDPVR